MYTICPALLPTDWNPQIWNERFLVVANKISSTFNWIDQTKYRFILLIFTFRIFTIFLKIVVIILGLRYLFNFVYSSGFIWKRSWKKGVLYENSKDTFMIYCQFHLQFSYDLRNIHRMKHVGYRLTYNESHSRFVQ